LIIKNLSHSEYHKRPEIGASDLKQFRLSPAHFRYWKDHGTEETDAQRLGTLAHCLILEPEKFSERFCCGGKKLNWTKRDGREQKMWQQDTEMEGLKVVYDHELQASEMMDKSIRSNEFAKELLTSNGLVECTVLSEVLGAQCKCRPDRLVDSGPIIDIKSTRCAHKDFFSKDALKYGYHIQAALYLDIINSERGHNNTEHFIIAIENEPPYGVCIHLFPEMEIELGRHEYRKYLTLLQECMEYDSWPGYPEKPQELHFPRYAFDKEFMNLFNETAEI